ncbi:hypothetical protein RM543_10270 [Roseicyclus sp. F158]|uniref:Uncharacterized protein n=1 Tax=Tropicimonas omnivorans TaxID=3075590 RepID=A0ABU3DH80_9RHOB|nr:hypothetical protein [Roseicyclus sp. F158]MDT0683071.1 hypothetical protein [Roseicyclus sp. F158]
MHIDREAGFLSLIDEMYLGLSLIGGREGYNAAAAGREPPGARAAVHPPPFQKGPVEKSNRRSPGQIPVG